MEQIVLLLGIVFLIILIKTHVRFVSNTKGCVPALVNRTELANHDIVRIQVKAGWHEMLEAMEARRQAAIRVAHTVQALSGSGAGEPNTVRDPSGDGSDAQAPTRAQHDGRKRSKPLSEIVATVLMGDPVDIVAKAVRNPETVSQAITGALMDLDGGMSSEEDGEEAGVNGAAGSDQPHTATPRQPSTKTQERGNTRDAQGMRPQVTTMDMMRELGFGDPVYSFGLTKGLVLLRETQWTRHNVSVLNVTLNALEDECMGGWINSMLLDNMLGYRELVLNGLVHLVGARGFVHDSDSRAVWNLRYAQDMPGATDMDFFDLLATKLGVVILSSFTLLSLALFVNLALEHVFRHIVGFIMHLRHHARHRIPIPRVYLTRSVFTILTMIVVGVGMLHTIIQLVDEDVAWAVITIMWLLEMYNRIALRSLASVQLLPKFVLLYLYAFMVYLYSFPYGYHFVALMSSFCFVTHAVLFFFHNYELPAMAQGRFTPQHLRDYPVGEPVQQSQVHVQVDNTVIQFRFDQTGNWQVTPVRVPDQQQGLQIQANAVPVATADNGNGNNENAAVQQQQQPAQPHPVQAMAADVDNPHLHAQPAIPPTVMANIDDVD